MNYSTRSCLNHRWSFHWQRGTTSWHVCLGFQIQLWRWFLGLNQVSSISPEYSSLEIYLVGVRCYLLSNCPLSPLLFFVWRQRFYAHCVSGLKLRKLFCSFVVKQCLFHLSLSLSSVPTMILGCSNFPAVGNSVFVRRPNNLCTGDDPILGEGVLH